MSNQETVTVVIVTYNRLALLQECIEALRGQSRRLDRILVVNNGSTDGTKQWLDTQADLTVIHQANLGGAGGFHTGVKSAHENKADFVWIMDDDTIPEPTALDALLDAYHLVGEAGFVCSRVVFENGVDANQPTLERFRDRRTAITKYLKSGIIEVESCSFVSVLIPSIQISKAGYPLAQMYIWGDDVEYTLRCSKDKPGYLTSRSVAIHKTKATTGWSVAAEVAQQRIKMFKYLYANNVYINYTYGGKLKLAQYLKRSCDHLILCLKAPDHRMDRMMALTCGIFTGIKVILFNSWK